jgi:hypothetical protein
VVTGRAATTSRSTSSALTRTRRQATLLFLGSVKWLETGQFDEHDLVALQRHRAQVTDEPIPLIAVTRSGASATHADAVFTPADLIPAW